MTTPESPWSEIDLNTVPGYVSGSVPNRLDELDFDDELELVWGRRWGAPSKIGKLHTVLVSRPGTQEINDITRRDPTYFLYSGKHGIPGYGFPEGAEDFPDLGLMQRQHDAYVEVLRSNGIEVIYANFPDGMTGAYLPYRGAGYPASFMIRNGCVIGRSALAWKRGQEAIWTRKMAEIGVPILYTMHGSGIFEGRIDWIDPYHVLLNVGHRANREGFIQMEWILKHTGVREVVAVDLPYNVMTHLDVVFTMVAHRLALVYPPALPYETLMYLKSLKVEVIAVPPEEARNIPCNAFPLSPGRIVLPSGSPRTVAALEAAGVEVIQVDLSESVKLGAGPDCMTLSLLRDAGPYVAEDAD